MNILFRSGFSNHEIVYCMNCISIGSKEIPKNTKKIPKNTSYKIDMSTMFCVKNTYCKMGNIFYEQLQPVYYFNVENLLLL